VSAGGPPRAGRVPRDGTQDNAVMPIDDPAEIIAALELEPHPEGARD
jgi:hypothetical protein